MRRQKERKKNVRNCDEHEENERKNCPLKKENHGDAKANN